MEPKEAISRIILGRDRWCIVKVVIVDCYTSCRIRCLIDANQSVTQFEHVVAKGNDDELCIFRSVLDVIGYN